MEVGETAGTLAFSQGTALEDKRAAAGAAFTASPKLVDAVHLDVFNAFRAEALSGHRAEPPQGESLRGVGVGCGGVGCFRMEAHDVDGMRRGGQRLRHRQLVMRRILTTLVVASCLLGCFPTVKGIIMGVRHARNTTTCHCLSVAFHRRVGMADDGSLRYPIHMPL